MEDGMFLHVGPPAIRLLPVELLLTPNRRPLVFRPKLSKDELESLLRSLRSLIGQQYDTVRVYSFVGRLALQSFLGARFPLAAPKLLPTVLQPQEHAREELVYDNSHTLPLASASWMPKGVGSTISPEAAQLAAANRVRDLMTGVRTIGGRNEEYEFMQHAQAPTKTSAATTASSSSGGGGGGGSGVNGVGGEAVICTDAILPRLISASAEWRDAVGMDSGPGSASSSSPTAASSSSSSSSSSSGGPPPPFGSVSSPLSRTATRLRRQLDYFRLRSWSINDVFSLSKIRPDLLTRVKLPPVTLPHEFADLDDKGEADAVDRVHAAAMARADPSLPLFDSVAWKRLDGFLHSRYPSLHSSSQELQQLLSHIWATSNPAFKALLQLYSYTVRRLPPQLAAALRLYIVLIILRKMLALWHTFVLVHKGAKLVGRVATLPTRKVGRHLLSSIRTGRSRSPSVKRGMVARLGHRLVHRRRGARSASPIAAVAAGKKGAAAAAAAASIVAPAPVTRRSRWRRPLGRSASLSPARSASPLKGAHLFAPVAKQLLSDPDSTASSSTASSRLARLLSHRRTHAVAQLLAGEVLPPELLEVASAAVLGKPPSSSSSASTSPLGAGVSTTLSPASVSSNPLPAATVNLLSSLLNKSTGPSTTPADSVSAAASPSTSSLPSPRSRLPLQQLVLGAVSSAADNASGAAAASGVPPAPTSGRKRAALWQMAKGTAQIAFPRTARLLHFTKEEIRHTVAEQIQQQQNVESDVAADKQSLPWVRQAATQLLHRLVEHKLTTMPPAQVATATPSGKTAAAVAAAASAAMLPATGSDNSAAAAAKTAALARSVQFALDHPNLAATFEQLKLFLLSALIAQFVQQIRSSL